MRLRYHKLSVNECISLVEFEPQKRTLLYGYNEKRCILNLPYLYFLFQYDKIVGSYRYNGIHHNNNLCTLSNPHPHYAGLKVFFANKKLESFDDYVFYSPTERHSYGGSCTNHELDGTIYKSPKLLMKNIINSWWFSPFQTTGRCKNSNFTNFSELELIKDPLKYNWGFKEQLNFFFKGKNLQLIDCEFEK